MKKTRFDEIVFADDFFRSSANLLHSHPLNRRFLRRAFETSARRLGLHCRELCAASDGGSLDVTRMMRALSLTPSASGWARSSIADLDPLVHQGLLPKWTAQTLVIGWGMTPALLNHLDRAGISFIDVELSPLRFASHLSFNMRSNDRQIQALLESHRIDEELFWNEATALAAFFARRGAGHLFDPGLKIGLFCGQCAIDLALVCGGEVARPLDVVDGARALAKEVDLLLIKPHPYEPDLRLLKEFAAEIPNAAWSDANIYALMCADNLRFVSALSSGAAREAEYFLKEGLQLATPDRDNPKRLPASCSGWIAVGPDILSLEALSAICEASAQVPRAPQRAAQLPADTLDRAFGTRWGLDVGSRGLPALPALAEDGICSFGAGDAATACLSFGWSAPEPDGSWTVGERACLVLPAPGGEAGLRPARQLVIEGRSFAGKPGRRPELRVRIGADMARWAGHRFLFDLPAGDAGKPLVIEFDILNPASPCECGLSEDCRLLGFHLRAIRFQRQGVGQPLPGALPKGDRPSPVPARRATRLLKTGAGVSLLMLLMAAGSVLGFADGTTVARLADTVSPWAVIRQKVNSDVELMRADLHLILKRHDI